MICWSCRNVIPIPVAKPSEIAKISEHVIMSEQQIGCCYCNAKYTIETYLDEPSPLSAATLDKVRNISSEIVSEPSPKQRPFIAHKVKS